MSKISLGGADPAVAVSSSVHTLLREKFIRVTYRHASLTAGTSNDSFFNSRVLHIHVHTSIVCVVLDLYCVELMDWLLTL